MKTIPWFPLLSLLVFHDIWRWTSCANAFQLAPKNCRTSPQGGVPSLMTPMPPRQTAALTRKHILEAASSEPVSDYQLDFGAIGKYATAIGLQMALFYSIFRGVDYLVHLSGVKVPFALNFVTFWFVALKSRVLNPMNNSRPKTDNLETNANKRNMPSWTPPGVVFPIMWLLIIGPLRAFTTAMVYSATGTYANLPILSLMLHLSIGDVWNSINNVERRYGASVVGVLLVWLSKAHAAYRYGQVVPLAGKLLCIPLVWLTIASSLIIRTWQLNPDPATGRPYPLYPAKGQGETRFSWFGRDSE